MRCLLPLACVTFIGLGAGAWAHRPFFSDGSASSPERALVVSDPGLSQVIYHEVRTPTDRLWLTFDLQAGQEVYLQVGVPVLERLKGYRPAFALVGPGLPAAKASFPLPAGCGAQVWRTDSVGSPRFFHEPFTGTDSWILREATVKVPQTGRYYAVAFVPDGRAGKLWLAVGTREDWGPADLLKMGEIRRKVRTFHEVPVAPPAGGG